MKILSKKVRHKIYKQILNDLSNNMNSNNFRICIKLNNKTPNNILGEINSIFKEFFLFKGINEDEWWSFFMEENQNELRVFSLQLCIEMTK